ncbi:MAG: hypothetical protein ACSW8F_06880 [bacterium]
METKHELFSPAEYERLKKQKTLWTLAAALVALGALVFCVLCCLGADTLHAAEMEKRAILASGLSGCVVIYILTWQVTPLRRELTHTRLMLEGEREAVTGLAVVGPEKIYIPGGVVIRRVTVETGGTRRRLSINARKAKRLPAGRLTLYAVSGFIAAYEEAEA